jgi:hypothetical protein
MDDRGERNRTEGMVLGNRLRMVELEMVRFARKTGEELGFDENRDLTRSLLVVMLLSSRSCSCLRILHSLCTSPNSASLLILAPVTTARAARFSEFK